MSFDFRDPEFFTAGAVGPPGQRVFYLQVSDDGVAVSLRIEKQQVHALAEYLQGLLAELPDVPVDTSPHDLVEPIEPVWAVGNIGVGYDNDSDRVIVVAEELTDDPESDNDEARIMLRRDQCLAFIERAEELMAGSRPPCKLCGGPIDPTGHACPRYN